MNHIDPVSIFEIGAKMAFFMLAMSYHGRKLRQGGKRNVAESNAGGKRKKKNYKETDKGLEGKREEGHNHLRIFYSVTAKK